MAANNQWYWLCSLYGVSVRGDKGGCVIRVADPSDSPAISGLLYEYNGQALSPEVLAGRLVQAHDLETAFLGKVGGVPAGLLVLTVLALSDAEDCAEITEP